MHRILRTVLIGSSLAVVLGWLPAGAQVSADPMNRDVDVDVVAELEQLRADLEATRREAEAAAEREAEAEATFRALEEQLAEIEAESAAARAEGARRRAAATARDQIPDSPAPKAAGVDLLGGVARVLSANSNLRAGPGLNQPVREVLASGTAVRAYGVAGDWTRIRLPDGRTGWIFSELLAKPL